MFYFRCLIINPVRLFVHAAPMFDVTRSLYQETRKVISVPRITAGKCKSYLTEQMRKAVHGNIYAERNLGVSKIMTIIS